MLVIVESPRKIEKIQHILGDDFVVTASVGHIIDLDSKTMSIDIDNGFIPQYQVIEKQHQTVNNLNKLIKRCNRRVLLATDGDREGEMIAWSIAFVFGLDEPRRIRFNAITDDAVLDSLNHISTLNSDLVDAQKARRILDRLVGYTLSPILRNVGRGCTSAGRVQSVVVRLIVERESEIKQFLESDIASTFRVSAVFARELHATLTNSEPAITSQNARDVMQDIVACEYAISDVHSSDHFKSPPQPYTTSTLQQDAFRQLRFSPKQTMTAAQRLYEQGHITYMRTDSTYLSPTAVTQIRNVIRNRCGSHYVASQTNRATTRKQNKETGAHEAIRPTHPENSRLHTIDQSSLRLYDLIWRRAVGSLMAPMQYTRTAITITSRTHSPQHVRYTFATHADVVTFLGFMILQQSQDMQRHSPQPGRGMRAGFLPKYRVGHQLAITDLEIKERYAAPPSRYTDASLVNALDPSNLNIGRPSTYVSIIEKIRIAGYVTKQEMPGIERQPKTYAWSYESLDSISESTETVSIGASTTDHFVPTALGLLVTRFLLDYFAGIVDYAFTSRMEAQLDNIAAGDLSQLVFLREFYDNFSALVSTAKALITDSPASRMLYATDIGSDAAGYVYKTTSNKYGNVLVRIAPTGKISYAPLRDVAPDRVSVAHAVNVFEFPVELGKYNRKKVHICRGKYGFYVTLGCGANATKYTVKECNEVIARAFTLKQAVDIINASNERIEKSILWKQTSDDGNVTYTIKDGPYGLYVNVMPATKSKSKTKSKGTNHKLPADTNIDDVTVARLVEIINTPRPKRFKPRAKK